ncbi:phospholipase-like protein [Tanacetum coccineum]
MDTVWLTDDIEQFIGQPWQLKCKFSWSDDYTVDRNLWLRLVCLDPGQKGWLSEEHIDLWVDYMWNGRPENANWSMVSCYFVQILLQNIMPLFYANGDKYATPWSDVDQVFMPINETAQHWCLAHLDILSRLVTFYDSGDTYDYEWRDSYVRVRECLQLNRLAISGNSCLVKDVMVKLFEIDNETDFRIVRKTYAMCQELNVHCQERQEQMMEMQSFLHVLTVLAESYNLLKELYDYELEKWCPSGELAMERLPVILEGAKVFDKKIIHPSDYIISFKLADNVPKHGDIFGDCGVWVCVFLYRLTHGLSLDVEDPVDVALAYCEKMVTHQLQLFVLLLPEEGNTFHHFSILVYLGFIYNLLPRIQTFLEFSSNRQKVPRYVKVPIHLSFHHNSPHHGQVGRVGGLTEFSNRTNENPENYVVFEVNYDGVFMDYPLRCSLEEGLTIVEGDGDMNKMHDMGEKYGLIDLYICHIPKNLAEYYYKNLTFDAADEDVLCKVKTHEKRMRDAGSMSPEELNLFGEFLHCDSVADEVILHDNWEYEGLILDAGGNKLPLLLKKKGRSRVNVTRKRTSQYKTKIKRLRKGIGKRVSGGANYGRLGNLIGLNEHEGDDDPQVTTQVSLTVGSTNNDVKAVD